MNRVMIDLETLGTRAGSVIATIGAVRFTPERITDRIYLRLDVRAQQEAGMEIDADTVLWWLKREPAAREEIVRPERTAPRDALVMLTGWLTQPGKVEELWGNGADFDCILLDALYRRFGVEVPWRYRAHRCYRTLAALYPLITLKREGTYHNALHDAESQAAHLQEINRYIHRGGTTFTAAAAPAA